MIGRRGGWLRGMSVKKRYALGGAWLVVLVWVSPARGDVAHDAATARRWVSQPAERTRVVDAGPVVTIEALRYAAPRPLRVWVIRLEVTHPEVRFAFTEPREFSGDDARFETPCATTLEFARQRGVQIAVNTSAFGPYRPRAGLPMDVVGLAAVRGQAYSDPHDPYGAMYISRERTVRLAGPPLWCEELWHVVPGFRMLLDDGRVAVAEDRAVSGFGQVNPRTAVGTDQAGRTLWLVVVDGRQAGVSEGITLVELACLFAWLGAWDALNLDGGGSTTLVVERPDHTYGTLNTPMGNRAPNTLRQVANNLGVYLPKAVTLNVEVALPEADGLRRRIICEVGRRVDGATASQPTLLRWGTEMIELPTSARFMAARETLQAVMAAMRIEALSRAGDNGDTGEGEWTLAKVRELCMKWFAEDERGDIAGPDALCEIGWAVRVSDARLLERGDLVRLTRPQHASYGGVFWGRDVDADGRTVLHCWPAERGRGFVDFVLSDDVAREQVRGVRLVRRRDE